MSIYGQTAQSQLSSEKARWIDRAKSQRVEDVARKLGSDIFGRGSDLKGSCPACNGTDRFGVNIPGQKWVCRKCVPGGIGGYGPISLVKHVLGCDYWAAIEWLTGEPQPGGYKGDIDKYLRNRRLLSQRRKPITTAPPTPTPHPRYQPYVAEVYTYKSEAGAVLYQTQRIEYRHHDGSIVYAGDKPKKSFAVRTRCWDDEGGFHYWQSGLNVERRVPYRLPQLLKAVAAGDVVFFVEGERKVDVLEELGMAATCIAFGANGWHERYSYCEYFRDGHVVILPDNDEPGFQFAATVAAALKPITASVQVNRLPGLGHKEDVVDWLRKQGI